MRFTTRKLLAATAALAICCTSATFGWSWLTRKGVDIHQRGVMRELTEWGNKYAQINDDASAIHAAGMIGYIDAYYVPGDGYRGFDETERALETARASSLLRIIEALEAYSEREFGDDRSAWMQWANSQKQPHSEP